MSFCNSYDCILILKAGLHVFDCSSNLPVQGRDVFISSFISHTV